MMIVSQASRQMPGPARSAIALSAMMLPAVVSAHHSFGLYSDQITEVNGELVSVDWRNPHIYFTVRSTNDEGEEERWTLEAGALYSVERRGITQALFHQFQFLI